MPTDKHRSTHSILKDKSLESRKPLSHKQLLKDPQFTKQTLRMQHLIEQNKRLKKQNELLKSQIQLHKKEKEIEKIERSHLENRIKMYENKLKVCNLKIQHLTQPRQSLDLLRVTNFPLLASQSTQTQEIQDALKAKVAIRLGQTIERSKEKLKFLQKKLQELQLSGKQNKKGRVRLAKSLVDQNLKNSRGKN